MKKDSSGIAFKLIFIGIIIIALMVANVFIGNKLHDRQYARKSAVDDINFAAGGSLQIEDISILVPYIQHKKIDGVLKILNRDTYQIHAKVLNYNVVLNTEERKLGIYSAPVFTGELKIDGEFLCNIHNDSEYTYSFEKAKLQVVMKDSSIIETPVFTVNDVPYETVYLPDEYDSDRNIINVAGVYSDIGYKEGKNTFSTTIKVRGARCFSTQVCSDSTKISVKSDYPAPGFTGFDYLPVKREITNDGFTAEWNIPFGTNTGKTAGFIFAGRIDVYKMLDRAVNYGFLFVIVPFIVLFLFEIFLNVNLHPVNYLLCGAASIVFFLLLLSFSEHITFTAAYIVSALASGVMISLYVCWITGKYANGFKMAGVFILMYGYLFFSLRSEDYALLIGSIFTFLIIAILMYTTRKVDWNNLKKNKLENTSTTSVKSEA